MRRNRMQRRDVARAVKVAAHTYVTGEWTRVSRCPDCGDITHSVGGRASECQGCGREVA